MADLQIDSDLLGNFIEMNVTIFGSGYVGLVTGACLAEVGNNVLCIDIDKTKVDALNKGVVPIFEPGLEKIISKNRDLERLEFSTNVEKGVEFSALQIIAVGTPPNEDGSADLQHVLNVATSIGRHMSESKLIVGKSTVPVGTADKISKIIQKCLSERECEFKFNVCSNPEFLKEGAAIEDFMKPDRIIIGADNEDFVDLIKELYAPFNRNRERLIFMDVKSAELTKYAANAMLATKISFMNELSNISEKVGADIEKVRIGIGSDPRIGYQFIYPGCGYGGSCFPKDVKALIKTAYSVNSSPRLLEAVEDVNARQKQILFHKIKNYFNGNIAGKTFAIWGLAFKPNTDDMREASSIVLTQALLEEGAKVQAYDPIANNEAREIFKKEPEFQVCNSSEDTLSKADALVIITEWTEFRSPNFPLIKSKLNYPVIFDGRNLYDVATLEAEGIVYFSIGR
tara:strand:- start:4821 stop:6188 length:1368 start_codon:yes stop_codon:yes gene_type:complete